VPQVSGARALLEQAFAQASQAAAPAVCLPPALAGLERRPALVLGAGKAAASMAAALHAHWGAPVRGMVVTRYGHGLAPGELAGDIEIVEAGHPSPDSASVAAGARLLELAAELGVEITQMHNVTKRIGELALGERAAAPVGEARSLVEVTVQEPLHQHRVAHGFAEAADHGGNLRVEDPMGDHPRQMMDNFNVLARRMKDLQYPLVDHQIEEGLKVEPWRETIDQHLSAVRRHLDEAELRPKGLLAHEFGVHRHKRGSAKPRASFG